MLSSKAYYAHETLAYNVREKLLFDIHNVLTHRECIPIQNSDKTSILSYDTLLTGIYDASFYRLKFSKCFSDTMDEGFLSHPCNENPDYVSMLFLTTIDDILEYNSTLAFKLITSKYINTAFKEWANYPLEQITSKISGIYSQLNMPSKEPMYMLLTLSYLKKQQWRSNKNEVLFSLNTRELGYIPSSLFKITRAYELSLCLNVKELLS